MNLVSQKRRVYFLIRVDVFDLVKFKFQIDLPIFLFQMAIYDENIAQICDGIHFQEQYLMMLLSMVYEVVQQLMCLYFNNTTTISSKTNQLLRSLYGRPFQKKQNKYKAGHYFECDTRGRSIASGSTCFRLHVLHITSNKVS